MTRANCTTAPSERTIGRHWNQWLTLSNRERSRHSRARPARPRLFAQRSPTFPAAPSVLRTDHGPLGSCAALATAIGNDETRAGRRVLGSSMSRPASGYSKSTERHKLALMWGGPPRSWAPTGNDALVGLRSTDETDFAGEKRVPEDPRGPEGPPSGPPHIAALHRLAAYSLYRSATRPVCASPG